MKGRRESWEYETNSLDREKSKSRGFVAFTYLMYSRDSKCNEEVKGRYKKN